MRINWKRFTLGALLLTSLSLFLFGCSDFGGSSTVTTAPVTKTISGVVADPATGYPLTGATVTAYRVTDGAKKGTLLSLQAATSDANGKYTLKIPQDYTGSVVIEAQLPAAASKSAAKAKKQVSSLTTGLGTIRATLPNISTGVIPPAMISLPTEMLARYIEINKGGVFSGNNIKIATLVLESIFGPNFTQTPPPAIGSALTASQQRLLVMVQALNSLPANYSLDLLLTATGTTLNWGDPSDPTSILSVLNSKVQAVLQTMISSGTIPTGTTMTVTAPATELTESQISDTTPPSAPTGLAVTVTTTSATLTWTASTDSGSGVANYFIYRDGLFIAVVSASGSLTCTDSALSPGTTYAYEVKARDAAGNLSAGSTVSATTKPLVTYAISGTIVFNNTGLAGVIVTITGTGAGSVVTDSSGKYTVTGVRPGSYIVTPLLSGYAFSPATKQVTVVDADVTVNFASVLSGSATGDPTYPDGSITNTTTYPDGSIVTTTTFPDGTITIKTTYPNGTITVKTTYPSGTVSVATTYPDGTVILTTTYPDGTVTVTTTYPNGTVVMTTTYPNGTVTTSTTYPNGTVITVTTYPNGTVSASTPYPTGSVTGGLVYP